MVFWRWPPVTLRSICSKAGALAAALAVAALACVTQPAAADDRDALERGRTAGRTILILRDPRACGIALLHARCVADVDAFLKRNGEGDADYARVPNVGKHPATGLRAFAANGDRDALDLALTWFNAVQSTEPMWRDDPRAAALYDAGIVDVLLPAGRGYPPFESPALLAVGDLARHAARVPAGTLPLDVARIRDEASVTMTPVVVGKQEYQGSMRLSPAGKKYAHELVAALDTTVPPAPLATLAYGDDVAGDAALGLAGATVRQLAETPAFWLVQADVQRFIDAYIARLRTLAPDRARDADQLRGMLRGAALVDFGALKTAHTRLLGAVIGGATERGGRASLAFAVAEIPYNAMIERDEKSAATLLGVVGRSADLDAVAGFAAARAEASTLGPRDWIAQYRFGLRLVDLLTKGGSN